MKALGIVLACLLGLLCLAVVGRLVAGLRSGAGRGAATVTIGRPPAQVFLWLEDHERTKKWVAGLVSIEEDPGTAGRVGSRARMVVEMGKERTEMVSEVTALERPKRLEFILHSVPENAPSGFTERVRYQLEEQPGGATRLTLSGETKYRGAMLRLMEPIISKLAQKKLTEDLARLKSLTEAEPVQPAGGVQ